MEKPKSGRFTRVALSLLLVALFLPTPLFASSGREQSNAQLAKYLGNIQALPEYSPSTAVFFGGMRPEKGYRGVLEELANIYHTISATQPYLSYYMVADDKTSPNSLHSPKQYWQAKLPRNFQFFWIPAEDLKSHPAYIEGDEEIGPWTRDYGPITGILKLAQKTSPVWLEFNNSDPLKFAVAADVAPFQLARMLKLPMLSPTFSLDGGNFMITGKGVCALSDKVLETVLDESIGTLALFPASVEDEKNIIAQELKKFLGCQKVIYVPPLPMEGTHHIDIFAKFIDDNTVLLNKYHDERVYVARV